MVFISFLNLDNLEIRKGKDLAKSLKLVSDLKKAGGGSAHTAQKGNHMWDLV